MKVPGFSILVLVVTAAFPPGTKGQEVPQVAVIKSQPRPMSPAELLNLLPDCPDQWVMKRSQARWLYLDNLEGYAVRAYERIIPPELPDSQIMPKPETVFIAIRDTCGLGPHLEPFRKETAPTVGGDFEIGIWDQYPAMMVRLGENRRSLRVLVKDRFVVELVFSGNNPKALNLWMKECNLQSLIQAKNRIPIIIGEKVTLEFLDELNPKRTRSYVVPVVPRTPANPLDPTAPARSNGMPLNE